MHLMTGPRAPAVGLAASGTLALLLMLAAPRAWADSISFIINNPNSDLCSNTSTCTNPPPYATVNVSVPTPGGDAFFTVTADTPYGIAGGGPAFAFNISDGNLAGLILESITPGFSLSKTNKQVSQFGVFNVVLSGPPPAGHPPTTLGFELDRSGGFGSANLFASNNKGKATDFFAAHIIPPNGKTGFAGGNTPANTPTPEPASLLLVGSGLVGFGAKLRRRRHQ